MVYTVVLLVCVMICGVVSLVCVMICGVVLLVCVVIFCRLVSVIVTNFPLEPTNVRYGAIACSCARNSCTNWPMQCVLCRDTVWLYGMVHHSDAKHVGTVPLSALRVKADEKEMVVDWSKKSKKRPKRGSGLILRWMPRMEGT